MFKQGEKAQQVDLASRYPDFVTQLIRDFPLAGHHLEKHTLREGQGCIGVSCRSARFKEFARVIIDFIATTRG